MNKDFENIIQNWSKAQKAGAILPCPRCGRMSILADIGANALSRRADIMICSKCGSKEAFEDMGYRGSNEPHSDDYKEEFIKNGGLFEMYSETQMQSNAAMSGNSKQQELLSSLKKILMRLWFLPWKAVSTTGAMKQK